MEEKHVPVQPNPVNVVIRANWTTLIKTVVFIVVIAAVISCSRYFLQMQNLKFGNLADISAQGDQISDGQALNEKLHQYGGDSKLNLGLKVHDQSQKNVKHFSGKSQVNNLGIVEKQSNRFGNDEDL